MILRDWRDAAPALLRPLYEREQQNWTEALGWDASTAWVAVEQARVTWGLPGFLACDDSGRIRGWTFYFPENGIVHIGGVAADSRHATGLLLHGVLDVAAIGGYEAVSCFIYEHAPALSNELARRGFEIEPFLYLSRDLKAGVRVQANADAILDEPAVAAAAADTWRGSDIGPAAALLCQAYGDGGRAFAPTDAPAEWEKYVQNLVEQTACGRLNIAATRVMRSGGAMEALVLVTTIAPATAHIAQVAIHPSVRRRGIAAALVDDACRRAAEQGCGSVTLLVGESNQPARALYRSAGFGDRGRFVRARKALRTSHPLRLNNVALVSGGATIFR